MTPKEINEAVARKLGWKYHSGDDGSNLKTPAYWQGPYEKIAEDPKFPDETYTLSSRRQSVPDYCGSIADAWEIMESAKVISLVPTDKGWHASSCDGGATEGECIELWYPTSCMTRDKDGCLRCAIADTAPMAICLAFLKFSDAK